MVIAILLTGINTIKPLKRIHFIFFKIHGGGNLITIGDKTYVWQLDTIYNRLNKENPNEIRFIIDELHDLKRETVQLCDAFAIAGDIPIFGFIGWCVSTVASSIGYGIAVNDYNEGKISKDKMARTHLLYGFGLIPCVGA
jgi:hypothetical protein